MLHFKAITLPTKNCYYFYSAMGYDRLFKLLQTTSIPFKKYTAQIICLQETHVIPFRNFSTPINYTIYTLNSAVNASGGVAIVIHNSIQHTEIHLSQDFESLCSKIHSKDTFNIICSYIPPRQHVTTLKMYTAIYLPPPSLPGTSIAGIRYGAHLGTTK